MKAWQTHLREPLLTFGKFLTVERHVVELPDGQVIDDWPWIITPDFVNIVAVTAEGRYLLFRQIKYAIDGESLAPVGGYIEPGEEPLAAAQRELLEETGYRSDHWTYLGAYRVDTNRGAGTGHFYLAQNATWAVEPVGGDLEEQHLLEMERWQVQEAVKTGQVKGMPWAAALAISFLWG